jgi:myo-inositol-1(or 4)-monophosphatase
MSAAAAAATIVRARHRSPGPVKLKGHRDIVTEVDIAAQAAAQAVIAARFPQHAILGEESAPDEQPVARPGEPLWVIDPIDGTTNFARGFPAFAVSIGVTVDGAPVAGVIVDPLRDETFYAAQGQGAYRRTGAGEPVRMRVTAVHELSAAMGGLDWARDPDLRREVVDKLARLAPACRTVRAIGSAALGIAYVAAGWLDVYYHLSLAPWDAVAAVALVREAGGRVTDLPADSDPASPLPDWDMHMPRLLATNGLLHDQARAVLAGQAPSPV